MHELGIAQNIIALLMNITSENQLTKVDNVIIQLGDLSGVVPESLLIGLQALSEGSMFQDTQFIFEKIAAKIQCRECQRSQPLEKLSFICKYCNSPHVDLLSGQELTIASVQGR